MVKDSIGKNSPPTKLKNKKRLSWIMGGLVLLFLLLGAWRAWNYFKVATATVPDLIGKTVPIAEDFIKGAKLKLSPDRPSQFSDKVEKDRIVEQDPKAGVKVRVDREIKVFLSKGPDTGKFPDLITKQMSKEDALILISNAGFTATPTFDTKPSATVAKGFVIYQNPTANIPWLKSGPIQLTISDGPQREKINMPNVIGYTSSAAKTVLEQPNNNLVVHIETQDSMTSPPDVVMSTTPKPGEAVLQGAEVTMTVSRGPGPIAQGSDPKGKKKIIANKVISEENS